MTTSGDDGPSTIAPKARLPKAVRRAQIIETAAGAFLQGGFDGTSMEDVAQAAGISRLLVYRNFDTKDQLYRAVLASVTDEFVSEFRRLDLTELRRRGGIVRVMLQIARRHPDAFRLLWRQAAHEPDFVSFARNFRAVLAEYSSAMITLNGGVIEADMMPWASRVLAIHLLDGMCTWLDNGDPARDDDYTVLQVCGLFAMIEAWGDPHPPPWLSR